MNEETIKCPHCGTERSIESEDYRINEDEEHNEECGDCGKNYVITHYVIHSWDVKCAENEHDLVASERHEGWSDCLKCGDFVHKLTTIK